MSEPLAYLLTWTCYGTWLHGDERGSVDRLHNSPGSPFMPPDHRRRAGEATSMSGRPIRLSDTARELVTQTIKAHCGHRSWSLHALNVRSNHVHVVLACDVHPRKAMRELKSWATRRLREARLFSSETSIWTEKGSHRFLWTADSLRRAIEYVMEYQGDQPDTRHATTESSSKDETGV